MALGFEIPSSAVDLNGNSIVAANTQIRPDKSLGKSSTPKVHLATFGDGYEQRLVDGINSIKQEFSLTFNTRTREEIDNIGAYFESLKGATSFDFTIPDSNVDSSNYPDGTHETTVKVVCADFNITYDFGDFYSCSATLRRVYEP